MKQAHGWMLQRINDIPYLLPYGQNIADFKRGIRINDTGAAVWDLFRTECSGQEAIDLFLTSYQIPEKDRETVTEDLQQFIEELSRRGMLRRDHDPAKPTPAENGILLSIGGLTLQLLCHENSFPQELFHKNFEPFVITHSKKIHQTVEICRPAFQHHPNGTILLRNEELIVCQNRDGWLLFFPKMPQIREVHLSQDGSYARFYCETPYRQALSEDLFHAIRLTYLYLAQRRGLYALHSASILYRDQAWLFSGHSGMGKSTHTGLWNRLFDVPVLNGDLNLLAVRRGTATVYGLPWCGTSGLFTTAAYPLGGIILLQRGSDNAVRPLEPDRQQLLVMQRFISPTWTQAQVRRSLDFAGQLADRVPIVSYACTKDERAAIQMKEWIDNHAEEPLR